MVTGSYVRGPKGMATAAVPSLAASFGPRNFLSATSFRSTPISSTDRPRRLRTVSWESPKRRDNLPRV